MRADVEQAGAVLFGFMVEMKVWDDKFSALAQQGGCAAREALAELRAIYEKYLARVSDGPPIFSVGSTAEYDPDAERILSIKSATSRTVIFNTVWTHPELPIGTQERRYTLVKKSGAWRLYKHEFHDPVRDRWITRAHFSLFSKAKKKARVRPRL